MNNTERVKQSQDGLIKVNEQTSFIVENDKLRIVFKDSDGITHIILLPALFYKNNER